jgi:hypothetical protein
MSTDHEKVFKQVCRTLLLVLLFARLVTPKLFSIKGGGFAY